MAKRKHDDVPADADDVIQPELVSAHLCAALGIDNLDSVLEVILKITPYGPATLTVERFVQDPSGLKDASKVLGLTTSTANVVATGFTSH